ncbi:MAG: signal peptidase II [Deltaproteobacteria bacterium]|jgi:signal peptidase II|nr:signal peptidase II [Deltaproteobacteria bacterium]
MKSGLFSHEGTRAHCKLFYALTFAGLALFLDILTKQLILRNLVMNEAREVTGFLNMVLVMNSGAAFSLFSGQGAGQGVKMALLSVVAMIPIVILYRMSPHNQRLQPAALGAILGGAVGNIHDRLRYNAVVDFLDFHIGTRHWPAFNVADVAVVAGLALFTLSLALGLRKPKGSPKKGSPDKNT